MAKIVTSATLGLCGFAVFVLAAEMFPAPWKYTMGQEMSAACVSVALYFALAQFLIARSGGEAPAPGGWIDDWVSAIAMPAPFVALNAMTLLTGHGPGGHNGAILTAIVAAVATLAGARAAGRIPLVAATRQVDLRRHAALVGTAAGALVVAGGIAPGRAGVGFFAFAALHAALAAFESFHRRSGLWRALAGAIGLPLGIGIAALGIGLLGASAAAAPLLIAAVLDLSVCVASVASAVVAPGAVEEEAVTVV